MEESLIYFSFQLLSFPDATSLRNLFSYRWVIVRVL